MTVTDLLQVRTYAEEAYVQFTLGQGPARCGRRLGAAPARARDRDLAAGPVAHAVRSRPAGLGVLPRPDLALGPLANRRWVRHVVLLVGNVMAVPLYSLLWRAGRVGGRARLGQPPVWSLAGLAGTLRFAAEESWEPIQTSLVLAAVAATITVRPRLGPGLDEPAKPVRGRSSCCVILALALATPGPGRRHGAGAGVSLVSRRSTTRRRSWCWPSRCGRFPTPS